MRFWNKHREFTFIDNSASIYEEYMNQKVMLHMIYVKNASLLDRHKVCACMVAAIIKTRKLLKGFVVARNGENGNSFVLPSTFHNISFVDAVTQSLFMANQLNGISTPLIADIFSCWRNIAWISRDYPSTSSG